MLSRKQRLLHAHSSRHRCLQTCFSFEVLTLHAGSAGTGHLIPHIQSQGVKDILAIDVAPKMLAELEKSYPQPSSLGNEASVRTWLGAFEELPLHQGRADVIFMNAVFGNLLDQHAALLHSSLLLNPGGKVVISHPLGAFSLDGNASCTGAVGLPRFLRLLRNAAHSCQGWLHS